MKNRIRTGLLGNHTVTDVSWACACPTASALLGWPLPHPPPASTPMVTVQGALLMEVGRPTRTQLHGWGRAARVARGGSRRAGDRSRPVPEKGTAHTPTPRTDPAQGSQRILCSLKGPYPTAWAGSQAQGHGARGWFSTPGYPPASPRGGFTFPLSQPPAGRQNQIRGGMQEGACLGGETLAPCRTRARGPLPAPPPWSGCSHSSGPREAA